MHHHIIIQTTKRDLPKEHEISAAIILSKELQTDIRFLRPEQQKTPDLEFHHLFWELKSPLGASRRTIENNLRTAKKQSQNIIVDLRRCKMRQDEAIARIRYYLSQSQSNIRRLKVITKKRQVIDIK